MIDIHTHVLPGVDDGSESLQMSLEMIKQAKDQGITHIILTPHAILNSSYYVEKNELKKKFQEFLTNIGDVGIKFYLGSEIYYTSKSFHKLIENELTTINNSKYCLIEFPMHEKSDVEESLYNVSAKGFKPILAHPERYKFMTIDELKLIKEHTLIQMNATSILGDHGKKIKKFAFEILKHNLVDFVASDCHNPVTRKVNLVDAHTIVSKKFGLEYANKIFIDNQKRLIDLIENQ